MTTIHTALHVHSISFGRLRRIASSTLRHCFQSWGHQDVLVAHASTPNPPFQHCPAQGQCVFLAAYLFTEVTYTSLHQLRRKTRNKQKCGVSDTENLAGLWLHVSKQAKGLRGDSTLVNAVLAQVADFAQEWRKNEIALKLLAMIRE